jgi:hypothetical protein
MITSETGNCCGLAELDGLGFDYQEIRVPLTSPSFSNWPDDYSLKPRTVERVAKDLARVLDEVRNDNVAVVVATTVTGMRMSERALDRMGFVTVETKCKRRYRNKVGRAITLWSRGVNDFTNEEDLLLAED